MKYLISLILISPILIFSEITEENRDSKIHQIISHIGAGVEYAKNSELGIFGQYNLNDNISIIGKVRRCTHDEKVYFSPGVKYYFSKKIYGIIPFVNIRYEKLHYDRKWSSTYYGYDTDLVWEWDPSQGMMIPVVRHTSYSTSSSGSSIINTQALSISGGGEYKINNIGINTSLGISHYTKIEGDSKEKNKLSFTIGVLYYFGK